RSRPTPTAGANGYRAGNGNDRPETVAPDRAGGARGEIQGQGPRDSTRPTRGTRELEPTRLSTQRLPYGDRWPAQDQGRWHELRASTDQGRQSECETSAGLCTRCGRHACAEPSGYRSGAAAAQDDRRVGAPQALVLRPTCRPRQV